MSLEGICRAKVVKWRCILGVMLKEPARGFIQATYCTLVTSLKTTLPCKDHQAYVSIFRVAYGVEIYTPCPVDKLTSPLVTHLLFLPSE